MLNTETMRPRGPIVIDIENITKHYIMGEETVHALRGITQAAMNREPEWRAPSQGPPAPGDAQNT